MGNALLIDEYKAQVKSLTKSCMPLVWPISFGSMQPAIFKCGHMSPTDSIRLPVYNTVTLTLHQDNGLFTCTNVANDAELRHLDGQVLKVSQAGDWYHPVFLHKEHVALPYSIQQALTLLKQV